jgi:hypothetical protein
MWKYCSGYVKLCLKERRELWPFNGIRHHDNVPDHKAHSVMQFVVQKSITEMKHSTSSYDLALTDLWLFQKIKSALVTNISGY